MRRLLPLLLLPLALAPSALENSERTLLGESTLHEGRKTYVKHWNFFARVDGEVDERSDRFFRDYETPDESVRAMLEAAGWRPGGARTERDVWDRASLVWRFLRENAVSSARYSGVSSEDGSWPSIEDYARDFDAHEDVAWAACFSKAHLFATLLGRFITPRDRVLVASTHHTMNGAPPTATHVYVALYVADRWFYLDPSYAKNFEFPTFEERRSLGCPTTGIIDYEHPYKVLRLPTSTVRRVPLLPN